MSPLLSLPRELRDLIYEQVFEHDFIYISPTKSPSKLFVSMDAQSLLLVNSQIHTEAYELMLLRASIVLCFDKAKPLINESAILASRTKSLTAIIDLGEIMSKGWNTKDDSPAVNATLVALVANVESTLGIFENLETVEIQWWNDLSVSENEHNLGRWTNALIKAGLVRSQELWFGYLGGRLGNIKQIYEHIVSSHNLQRLRELRIVPKGGLRLLNEPAQESRLMEVTPLSFF